MNKQHFLLTVLFSAMIAQLNGDPYLEVVEYQTDRDEGDVIEMVARENVQNLFMPADLTPQAKKERFTLQLRQLGGRKLLVCDESAIVAFSYTKKERSYCLQQARELAQDCWIPLRQFGERLLTIPNLPETTTTHDLHVTLLVAQMYREDNIEGRFMQYIETQALQDPEIAALSIYIHADDTRALELYSAHGYIPLLHHPPYNYFEYRKVIRR